MLTPEPVFWHWWAFGGALLIVEAFVPGFVFLWLGVAAAVVGSLLWLWPGIGTDFQVLMFAGLSVASVLGWRRWRDAHPPPSDQPHLNRRGAQYVGRRGQLVEPIANGRGRIRLGDSSWAVYRTGPPGGRDRRGHGRRGRGAPGAPGAAWRGLDSTATRGSKRARRNLGVNAAAGHL